MSSQTGRGRSWRLAGLLGLTLLAPTSAFAIFPPVIQPPTVTVTKVPVDPPVVIQGDPGPPPVVAPPVVRTPEPATLVTGLIGLVFGRRLLRRQKVGS